MNPGQFPKGLSEVAYSILVKIWLKFDIGIFLQGRNMAIKLSRLIDSDPLDHYIILIVYDLLEN